MSARDRNLRNTSKGRVTPRGISRPDPLQSHRLGEQEFILPTMIVASSMFGSPLSPPPVSCNQSKKLNRGVCFDFDDSSSAGY